MERSIAWITPFQSLGAWVLTTLVIALIALPLARYAIFKAGEPGLGDRR